MSEQKKRAETIQTEDDSSDMYDIYKRMKAVDKKNTIARICNASVTPEQSIYPRTHGKDNFTYGVFALYYALE